MNYVLRSVDELFDELRALAKKKKEVDDDYKAALSDIQSDIEVIKLEIQLSKAIGRNLNKRIGKI